MKPLLHSGRLQAALGLAALLVLALPMTRLYMEASMFRHMLVQFPLWLACGALLAGALPGAAVRHIGLWNAHGLAGLTLASITLAVLMVPRVLDLALYMPQVELAKLAALLAAGAALRLSWRPAGFVLQFFFLGGILMMMAIVGMLYVDTPLRLCNAYLQDDQIRLGRWLTGSATVMGVAWLLRTGWLLMQQEAAYMAQDEPESGAPSAGELKENSPQHTRRDQVAAAQAFVDSAHCSSANTAGVRWTRTDAYRL